MIHRTGFGGSRVDHGSRVEPISPAVAGDASTRTLASPRTAEGEEFRARPVTIPLAQKEDAFLEAFRRGDPELAALYNARPIAEIRREIIARRYPRDELAELLAEQNQARGASRKTMDHIQKLREPDTCAVVTGQQVGLLGGPLYTLYKALAVVRESEELNRRGIAAIPLFWMASYDHDLREVSRIAMLTGAHEPEMLELAGGPQQRPVGDLPLGAGIGALLDRVGRALQGAPFEGDVMAKLREIYRPEETYAGAFSKWLGFLTDRFGLVILDPNCRAFHRLARPLLERELFLESAHDAIAIANQKIRALGFEPQIDLRKGQLSLFFVDDDGRRVPLARIDGGFKTGGRPALLTAEEARRILAEQPERFSPSALMRPIVEDYVIPTVAYVGGPSERKYYAQVGGLYRAMGIPNPAILSRPSFTVVDQASAVAFEHATHAPLSSAIAGRAREAVGRAGIPSSVKKAYDAMLELRAPIEQLDRELDPLLRQGAKRIVQRRAEDLRRDLLGALRRAKEASRAAGFGRLENGLVRAAERIEDGIETLRSEISRADPEHGRHPPHWPLRRIHRELNRLERQLLKVGRKERADLVSTLYRLSPRGAPQERTMTVAQLVAEHGIDTVVRLLESADAHQKRPELVITPSAGSRGGVL